jgi:hypothetical protein
MRCATNVKERTGEWNRCPDTALSSAANNGKTFGINEVGNVQGGTRRVNGNGKVQEFSPLQRSFGTGACRIG